MIDPKQQLADFLKQLSDTELDKFQETVTRWVDGPMKKVIGDEIMSRFYLLLDDCDYVDVKTGDTYTSGWTVVEKRLWNVMCMPPAPEEGQRPVCVYWKDIRPALTEAAITNRIEACDECECGTVDYGTGETGPMVREEWTHCDEHQKLIEGFLYSGQIFREWTFTCGECGTEVPSVDADGYCKPCNDFGARVD